MDEMISQFIDDELTLDEKPEFVRKIHDDTVFCTETLDFLEQEMLLRGDVVETVPDMVFSEPVNIKDVILNLIRPLSFGLAGALSMALVMWVLLAEPQTPASHMNRFVIFRPDVSRVEISGSFTGWKRIPLKPKGSSGYWEITLEIPNGVHRYTYILDGDTPYADPTILAAENDDFGGVNSILTTES